MRKSKYYVVYTTSKRNILPYVNMVDKGQGITSKTTRYVICVTALL
jgi:hypothetical protein